MRRGYFDDFTDLKETGGRMFPVAEGLAPASAAPAFPAFVVCMSPGVITPMPCRLQQPNLNSPLAQARDSLQDLL